MVLLDLDERKEGNASTLPKENVGFPAMYPRSFAKTQQGIRRVNTTTARSYTFTIHRSSDRVTPGVHSKNVRHLPEHHNPTNLFGAQSEHRSNLSSASEAHTRSVNDVQRFHRVDTARRRHR